MRKKRNSRSAKYLSDTELWETKQLGASLKHAKRAPAKLDVMLDNDLGLAPVSIRLQKDLVVRLKNLAKKEGLGYQTYIRQVLTRHVRELTEYVKGKASAE